MFFQERETKSYSLYKLAKFQKRWGTFFQTEAVTLFHTQDTGCHFDIKAVIY